MVNLGQVQAGVSRYLDTEIVSKMTGWQKWTFGALGTIAVARTTELFKSIKANPAVAMLGVIDDNDGIDLDTLYKEFKKQAQAGPITVDIPVIGALTLNETDVDKIYTYIQNS